MKLHHIGIIASDLEKNLIFYQKLGYHTISDPIVDLIQQNKLIFIKNPDSKEVLELIEPLAKNSSVSHSKNGYHHLCYEVNSLTEFAMQFNAAKIGKIFTDKISAPAFQGRDVIFAYLKNGTLLEFLEGENHEV